MNPASHSANKGGANGGQSAPQLPKIPFTHASHEHTEQISDTTDTPGVNTVQKGPFDIPAYGFLRNPWLLVECQAGGVAGPGVLAADAPFNVLQNVAIEDVNGTAIVGPYNGEELIYVNKYGGYQFFSDPENLANFVNGVVTFTFALRIPVEINPRTGLGCLSNMNSSANYKLRYTVNASSQVWSTAPTTVPPVRVRAFLEAWSYPPAVTRDGYPINNEPPLLGTTQYWTKRIVQVPAGQFTIPLTRVGNQLRNLVAIYRLNSGVRDDANYPDPITLNWDARTVFVEPKAYRQNLMSERFRYTRTARDVGVYVYDFTHDSNGHPGGEDDGHLWLRTVQSSRMEFQGTFGAAGTVTLLTNDVAPVATGGRFVETSATGGIPGAGGADNAQR